MKKRLHVKFMFIQPAPPTTESSDSDSDGESVSEVLKGLTAQMGQIDTMAKAIDSHVLSLYQRAKVETVDWMKEPLKPRRHIQKWCALHGLSLRPTIEEFTDACFAAAWSLDLESRVLTFKKDDAATLWNGQRRLTVFDMIGRIPTLFE
jgi:hypothetical protein